MNSLHQLAVVIFVVGLTGWAAGQDKLLVNKTLRYDYDAVYDLQNNMVISNPNVQVILPFTGTGCCVQGVLKLALASPQDDPDRKRVLIDLFFDDPKDWVFDLGDSMSNNGYGGDAGQTPWSAEVYGKGSVFTGYLDTYANSAKAFTIRDLYRTRLTLIAGDGHILWQSDNANSFNYYYNKDLFALSGHDTSASGIDYDLYLGLNRVIYAGTGDRVGTGLCKVGIKFLPDVTMDP